MPLTICLPPTHRLCLWNRAKYMRFLTAAAVMDFNRSLDATCVSETYGRSKWSGSGLHRDGVPQLPCPPPMLSCLCALHSGCLFALPRRPSTIWTRPFHVLTGAVAVYVVAMLALAW
ncbi:hypothetical protein BT63DRAFT_460306 [Microthyrium microscopicum]|uniref:Uncharacterized protein n=1 Tax=Microthyrium microscopicum TaxID=703497 RepID=A0A6A6U120_9PEZI|nr:hypothetical protein BT63DRAFT_460306 [Microthyrium microscopicum]